MDWKYEAIDKLRGYEVHKRSIQNIMEEITRLQAAFDGLRSTNADAVHIIGGVSDHDDKLLSNIVHRSELESALKQARLWVKTVDSAMSVLEENERRVLEGFYIHRGKGNVEELRKKLNIEKSQIYRQRDRALRIFTIALYGITES